MADKTQRPDATAEVEPPRTGVQALECLKPYMAPAYAILAVWLGAGLTLLGATLTRPNSARAR